MHLPGGAAGGPLSTLRVVCRLTANVIAVTLLVFLRQALGLMGGLDLRLRLRLGLCLGLGQALRLAAWTCRADSRRL